MRRVGWGHMLNVNMYVENNDEDVEHKYTDKVCITCMDVWMYVCITYLIIIIYMYIHTDECSHMISSM